MGKLIFISGGANSGKSKYAENLCRQIGGRTCYIATSKTLDFEMQIKKEKHIQRRKDFGWETVEEYKNLYKIIDRTVISGTKTYLLDCLTMMISNFMFDKDINFQAEDEELCEKIEKLLDIEIDNLIEAIEKNDINFIVVTNEIGMGIVAQSKLNRYYASLVGKFNQKMALKAQDAYLVVSGIGVKIK